MFLSLALLVGLGVTHGVDLAVTRAFQSIASYPLDVAANAHTYIGLLPTTLPFSIIVAIVAHRRLGGYAWLGPLFILGTGAIELAFKYLVTHPGPPHEFVRTLVDLSPPLKPPNSFPSGHAARLTFVSIVVASLFPSRLAWIAAAAFIAVTLYARVYIGDHWISDALGGLALGGTFGALAVAWMHRGARD